MKKLLPVPRNKNCRLPILALTLFFTACGTFALSGKINLPASKSSKQQQTDILACKAQAKNAADNDSQSAVPTFLNLTMIGALVTNEEGKLKQRKLFTQCMEALGYSVTPPNDDAPSNDDITL